jgi:hypothetical protein
VNSAPRPPGQGRGTRPVICLICVGSGTGPQEYGSAWRVDLAPQIEVVSLPQAAPPTALTTPTAPTAQAVRPARTAPAGQSRPGELASLLDDRPYAVFGRGPWALAALEVSRVLSRVRMPAQLQVASCPPPSGPTGIISWPVTAFAVAGPAADQADGMARWRSVTTGPFTLRLLPEPAAHQADGWADAGTLLAIKEELRVWPE